MPVRWRRSPAPRASAARSPTRSRSPGRRLLVTTADHALLDPAMLEHFLARGRSDRRRRRRRRWRRRRRSRPATRDTKRTYLRFRDGGYSGANLFLLRTAAAGQGIAFWRAHRARPQGSPGGWRARSGRRSLLTYLLRLCTLAQAMALVSRRLGARVAAIAIPIAEAAIDVDKPADLDLVESILTRRDEPGMTAPRDRHDQQPAERAQPQRHGRHRGRAWRGRRGHRAHPLRAGHGPAGRAGRPRGARMRAARS